MLVGGVGAGTAAHERSGDEETDRGSEKQGCARKKLRAQMRNRKAQSREELQADEAAEIGYIKCNRNNR